MAKFLILYTGGMSAKEQMANASPEEAKKGMDMWMEWAKKVGDKMVDMGSPLGDAQKVDNDGAQNVESKLGGYSIVEAESLDDAVKLMDGHPHLMMPGAQIKVLECLPMPGME